MLPTSELETQAEDVVCTTTLVTITLTTGDFLEPIPSLFVEGSLDPTM